MKASLSEIIKIGGTAKNVSDIGIEELVRIATNRLGGLEGVVEYGKRFDGVVVAKVVSSEPHKDSDHLHVCMIDAGDLHADLRSTNSDLIQVVCGASNVRAGQTVAWIPPGVVVPKTYREAEPFVLGKREIRGVMSNGMIASPNELGISDDHDGILEIDESEVGADLAKPGTEFKKLYGLDDLLLDFENKMFTHRPDCFGQIGLARELAGIQGLKYQSPDWYLEPLAQSSKGEVGSSKGVASNNGVNEKVPRFMLQVVESITVKPSPIWMQAFLTRVGVRPINNIVDWSNYYMHMTAQPTHAFDYDKVKKLCSGEVTIFPRMAKNGEKIKLLSGKEIELCDDDIVIATDKQPIALAGVMGGIETEVDENTKTIVIECATFDMYTIRRTSMRHGLFTDAVTRYTKGQSPIQNDRVLAKIVSDMCKLDGAKAGDTYDSGMSDIEFMSPIEITGDFINSRIGTNLGAEEISKTLSNVEIGVEIKGDTLIVTPPFWRTDLELKEDIVEEVGRLFGFDNIELKLPLRSTKPAARNLLLDFKQKLRDKLVSFGANELLLYSFVHGDLLKNSGLEDVDKWAFHIRNALSPELQYYRTSLMPSLLSKVHANIKSDMVRSGDNEFALFEIGKTHAKTSNNDEGLPNEFERLSFVFAADEKTAVRKYVGSAYYMAKKYLDSLLDTHVEYRNIDNNDYPLSMYQIGRSAMVYVDGELLGLIGEYRNTIKKAFKLPDYCAGFELDLILLQQKIKSQKYRTLGTFPKTLQDITFKVSNEKTYSEVADNISDALVSETAKKGLEFTQTLRDMYQKEGQDEINYTFRIWLWHPDKTLKTEEVNKILDLVAETLHKKTGASRV